MTKEKEFEKTIYDIIGSVGSCLMGAYALLMIFRHGFLGITLGIETFIKIGILISLVMMIASVILNVRHFLLLNKKDKV